MKILNMKQNIQTGFLAEKKKKKKGLQFGLPCRTPQKTWKCDNQEFKRQNLKEVNSSVWG